MQIRRMGIVMMLVVFVAACFGPPKIDPTTLSVMPEDTKVVEIPAICEPLYKSKRMSVAVLEFANNTTFGNMTAKTTNVKGERSEKSSSAAVAGFVASSKGVGIGVASSSSKDVKYSENKDEFMRQVAPAIGEFAQGTVEDTLVNMGGVDIFSRTQMEKILREQQFQMTMGDPNSAVQFGKLAGVSYMVTGSVDNIAFNYVAPTQNTNTSKNNALMSSLLTAAVNTQSGWNVNTEMTVTLIDVETGKIIRSKKVKGREVAGGDERFNPEFIVTAAKRAMGEAVADIKPDLSQLFEIKGYVNELRGGGKAALVSLGTEHGIKAGEKLEAFDFIVSTDFRTKEQKCTVSKMPIEIVVTNQVDTAQAWAVLKVDEKTVGRIKVGQLIKRAPLKGQSILDKAF